MGDRLDKSSGPSLDSLFARIAAHPTTALEPLREGEMCRADWERIHGWTADEAKKQIAQMLKRGEIEKVGTRKNCRAGDEVAGGKCNAYVFTDSNNGGAKSDEKKRASKAYSKPARRGGVDSRKSRRPATRSR